VSDDVRRRKGAVEHADLEQAISESRGPGTLSHGQRQSRAVGEDAIEGWVNKSSARRNQCGSR
jgi:hypothetical protein